MIDLIKEFSKIEDPVKDHGRLLANLYYTHFWLADKYARILKSYDITPQQANALSIVKEYHPEPLTLTQLKSGLLEKNADASRIIQRLSIKGMLKRKVDKVNRRKICITITDKGLKVMNRLDKDQPFAYFTSLFTLEEAKTLAALLAKIRGEF